MAIASDYNPGSTPSGDMKFAVSLACIKMRLMPAEAINAATINSAYAMGLSEEYGSITVGKVANFYITDLFRQSTYPLRIHHTYYSPSIPQWRRICAINIQQSHCPHSQQWDFVFLLSHLTKQKGTPFQ